MLDFTSALYLGQHHESWQIDPWSQLTLGVPAALTEPPGSEEVAQKLATLVGCQSAVLAPSTLHIFWDLLSILADSTTAIYRDASSYPITGWGVERAAVRGVTVHAFEHHNAASLLRLMGRRYRPIVVTDGICPGCGKLAPLDDYLEQVRKRNGFLLIDDTQAFGLLGFRKWGKSYGEGGGGSLRWKGIEGKEIIWCSSLAKAFGVPLAAMASSSEILEFYKRQSETRVHCSPPSVAVIHAARNVLKINAKEGDIVRSRLAARVRQFRIRLQNIGLSAKGQIFPIQHICPDSDINSFQLQERLARYGVKAVLQRPRCSRNSSVCFLINASHSSDEIDQAIEIIDEAIQAIRDQRLHLV